MAPLLLNLFILLSYPLNFFIYCAMSRQFRDAFRELCCLCCGVATAPADLGTSVCGRPGDREPRGRTSAGAEEPRRRGGLETPTGVLGPQSASRDLMASWNPDWRSEDLSAFRIQAAGVIGSFRRSVGLLAFRGSLGVAGPRRASWKPRRTSG